MRIVPQWSQYALRLDGTDGSFPDLGVFSGTVMNINAEARGWGFGGSSLVTGGKTQQPFSVLVCQVQYCLTPELESPGVRKYKSCVSSTRELFHFIHRTFTFWTWFFFLPLSLTWIEQLNLFLFYCDWVLFYVVHFLLYILWFVWLHIILPP